MNIQWDNRITCVHTLLNCYLWSWHHTNHHGTQVFAWNSVWYEYFRNVFEWLSLSSWHMSIDVWAVTCKNIENMYSWTVIYIFIPVHMNNNTWAHGWWRMSIVTHEQVHMITNMNILFIFLIYWSCVNFYVSHSPAHHVLLTKNTHDQTDHVYFFRCAVVVCSCCHTCKTCVDRWEFLINLYLFSCPPVQRHHTTGTPMWTHMYPSGITHVRFDFCYKT